MGRLTKIQWTDHTTNLWWGCTEVHSGCNHCYARTFARRLGKGDAWDGVRYAVKSVWKELARWQRDAAKAGTVERVFVGSMMDIAEKSLSAFGWDGEPLLVTTGVLRARFFLQIVPKCPNLEFQLLTKRPGNIPKVVPLAWLRDWPTNVITGASVVDQATADVLIPQLLKVPGRKFLSCEPLIGPVNLSLPGIDWVIVGGESGPNARPCALAWVRSIRDQCEVVGVPCFVKQIGANAVEEGRRVRTKDSHGGDPIEWPDDLRIREVIGG